MRCASIASMSCRASKCASTASCCAASARIEQNIHTNLTKEAVEALQELYPTVRAVEGTVEIESNDVSLYDVEDRLRPLGVEIQSIQKRQITLDDVFLELTGKELRE